MIILFTHQSYSACQISCHAAKSYYLTFLHKYAIKYFTKEYSSAVLENTL